MSSALPGVRVRSHLRARMGMVVLACFAAGLMGSTAATAAAAPRKVSYRAITPDLEVFMRVDASTVDMRDVERHIRQTPSIVRYSVLGQRDALRRVPTHLRSRSGPRAGGGTRGSPSVVPPRCRTGFAAACRSHRDGRARWGRLRRGDRNGGALQPLGQGDRRRQATLRSGKLRGLHEGGQLPSGARHDSSGDRTRARRAARSNRRSCDGLRRIPRAITPPSLWRWTASGLIRCRHRFECISVPTRIRRW